MRRDVSDESSPFIEVDSGPLQRKKKINFTLVISIEVDSRPLKRKKEKKSYSGTLIQHLLQGFIKVNCIGKGKENGS